MKLLKIILLVIASIFPAAVWLVAGKLEFYTAYTYPAGKLLMLVLPFLFWLVQGKSKRQIMEEGGVSRPNWWTGILTGLLFAAVILAAYGLLKERLEFEPIMAKMDSLGYMRNYWLFAMLVSFFNSGLEEFYFRSFILSQTRNLNVYPIRAVFLNGLIFSLHHFIALVGLVPAGMIFGLTIGTGLAGGFWAWMRVKRISIFDVYISHVIADLAIAWAIWKMI